jgi:DNA replication licensing factor MCM7
VYGRYNKKLSPHDNINLPAALLSRFDIIFLLLDTAESERDLKLAQHVTAVHQKRAYVEEKDVNQKVDAEIMRSFIAYAQTFNPTIPAELHNYIVARYVEKRKFQRDGNQDLSYTYITPRTLLAIIRISQSMAKFHFRDLVEQEDVDQAIKLIDFSFNTLQNMNERQSKRKFCKLEFVCLIFFLFFSKKR